MVKGKLNYIQFFTISLILTNSIYSQTDKVLPLFSNRNVYLFVKELPRGYYYDIYRRGPNYSETDEFLQQNLEPVRASGNPVEFKARAGDGFEWLKNRLNLNNEVLIYRRVMSNRAGRVLLSGLNIKIAQALGQVFVDSSLAQNETYEYNIIERNRSGKQVRSERIKFFTRVELPAPPENLSAESGDGKVEIKWEYFGDNIQKKQVIHFLIYRMDEGKKSFQKINQESIIRMQEPNYSYTDQWLENSKKYTYYVTSVDIIGRQSPPSQEVESIPEDLVPPSPPPMVNTKVLEDGILLVWPVHPTGDVSNYNVYRRSDENETFVQLNQIPVVVGKPYFVDKEVVGGKRYYYSVTAIDISGNESKKSNAQVIVYEDVLPPPPPSNVRLTCLDDQVNIQWEGDKTADLAGYYIFRGDRENSQLRLNHAPLSGFAYSDSGYGDLGFEPGRVFHYWVSSVDVNDNESQRVHATVKVPDFEAPDPPGLIKAQNDQGHHVKLLWSGSLSRDVVRYEIDRQEIPDKTIEIGVFSKDITNITDTDVTKGSGYIYQVVAIDSSDNRSVIGYSDTVWVKDQIAPPEPRRITARLEENGVLVKWQRVVDFDLSGYKVYRSGLATGIYQEVAKLPVETTSYLDNEGTENDWYLVRAIDTSKNLSQKSKRTPVKK